jgi:hypothetical protein
MIFILHFTLFILGKSEYFITNSTMETQLKYLRHNSILFKRYKIINYSITYPPRALKLIT